MSKAEGTAPAKREKRFIDIAVKDSGMSRKKLLQLGRSFEGTFSTTDVHCPAPTEDEYGKVSTESCKRYNTLNLEINDAAIKLLQSTTALHSTLSMLERVKHDRPHSESDTLVLRALKAVASRALSFKFTFHYPSLRFAARSESLDVLNQATGLPTKLFIKLVNKRLKLSLAVEPEYNAQRFLYDYAQHIRGLTEHLFDLIEQYPAQAEGIGSDFANWPFLLFRRSKENTPVHIWKQMERIQLGKTSATDAFRRENWNPLQRYLVLLLTEQRDFARAMDHWKNSPFANFRRQSDVQFATDHLFNFPRLGLLSSETRERYKVEAQLFVSSLSLPTPIPEPTPSASKSEKQKSRESRKQWVTKFYLPLIKLRESDLTSVRAFQDALSDFEHKSPEKSIEEGIIRALGKIVPKGAQG